MRYTQLWVKQKRWLSGRVHRRKGELKKESYLITGTPKRCCLLYHSTKSRQEKRLEETEKGYDSIFFCVCEINWVCKLSWDTYAGLGASAETVEMSRFGELRKGQVQMSSNFVQRSTMPWAVATSVRRESLSHSITLGRERTDNVAEVFTAGPNESIHIDRYTSKPLKMEPLPRVLRYTGHLSHCGYLRMPV